MTPRRDSDEPKPTMAERAAAAEEARAKASGGIECPKCGCRHFWVIYKRTTGTLNRRRIECRHCGHRETTYERIAR